MHSEEENDFISSLSPQGSLFWIDGKRSCDRSDCPFHWSGQNQKISYNNWRQGEPNNDRGNEDCIAVGWGKNLWNDVKCSVNWFAGYVCKKVSFI